MNKKHVKESKTFCFLWMIFFTMLTNGTLFIPNLGAENKGSFHLVGVGPGDADLITPRALDSIQKADMVFCDVEIRKILSSVTDFGGKEVVNGYNHLSPYYGKECSDVSEKEGTSHALTCGEYHKKQTEFGNMVQKAVKNGKHVVMLSYGDPTIYGADIWSLKELNDLDPVVIPGLSAFNAGNAALKAGLGEVVITTPDKDENCPDSLEKLGKHKWATMVIYNPGNIRELFARLSKIYKADTPAAVVNNVGFTGKRKALLGSVGEFSAKPPDFVGNGALVYVGKALKKAQFKKEPNKSGKAQGKYYLVGTGPGDSDLLTLRAINVIKGSDLIFAGKHISEKFESLFKEKKVMNGYHRLFPFYGKKCEDLDPARKNRERMSCEEYHKKQNEFAALVRNAVTKGKVVAMLDSGDPLVYGPCSWSLTELNDLTTEVIPGMSSFNAANAALRAGVDEGKSTRSIILASGWSVKDMAVHQSTMVLFTMKTDFNKFINALTQHYPETTPAAVVCHAGYARKEKVVHGTLDSISEQVGGNKKLPFEYLLYVGDFLNNSVGRTIP